MNAEVGKKFSTDVSAPVVADIEVRVGDIVVDFSSVSIGPGEWEIEVAGSEVVCPGPITIRVLGNLEHTVDIEGC